MTDNRSLRWFACFALLIGLATRSAPLLNENNRLFKQWVSEDGYLMLTIARNIGIGKGMSISDGEIRTNGTQPLVTLIFAAGFWVFDGDKTLAVYFAHIWQILMSVLSAVVLYLFSREVLKNSKRGNEIALTAASLWFMSPMFVKHSMNHLETGTFFLLILLSLWSWYSRLNCENPKGDIKSSVWIGMLLGITTLVRIDTVFLIAAVTVWNVLMNIHRGIPVIRQRLIQSFLMGIVSVLVTSPWLIYNKIGFGSFTPVSGRAQQMTAGFWENFRNNFEGLPAWLCEYCFVVIPIPHAVEVTSVAKAAALICLALWLILQCYLAAKANVPQRGLMAMVATVLVCFFVYYVMFFGAAHFLRRYFAPVGIFFGVSTCFVVIHLFDKWRVPFQARCVVCVGLLLLCAATQWREFRHAKHQHWQVVEWTEQHVDEDTWIGGIQTGTLGYFHDRTFNLDGKVNPEAFKARETDSIGEYIVAKPIRYLIDWKGILKWHDFLDDNFDIEVNEPERGYNGLGVLKRRE